MNFFHSFTGNKNNDKLLYKSGLSKSAIYCNYLKKQCFHLIFNVNKVTHYSKFGQTKPFILCYYNNNNKSNYSPNFMSTFIDLEIDSGLALDRIFEATIVHAQSI